MATEPHDVQRTEGEPHDRLTRICDEMIRTFDTHAEHHEGDKCIVFLDDGKRGGIVLNGYDDDMEAMVNLLMHLQAIFQVNGKELQIVTIPDDASEIAPDDNPLRSVSSRQRVVVITFDEPEDAARWDRNHYRIYLDRVAGFRDITAQFGQQSHDHQ